MNKEYFGKFVIIFLVIFISLSAIASILASIYFQNSMNEIKEEKKQELTAIADLKVNDIENWLDQRKEDALYISTSKRLKEYIDSPNQKTENEFKELIKIFSENHQFADILIVSENGRILYNENLTDSFISEQTDAFLHQCLEADSIMLTDFYSCHQCNILHIDIIAPVYVNGRNKAAVILRVDPNEYLFPFIQIWPTKSKTAETLIAEKIADSVVFINPLRHIENAPMNMKKGLDETTLPAALAVNREDTFAEGVDYRGERVIAAMREVKGTNWWMVSKMDIREAYNIIRQRAFSIYIIAGLVILLIASLSGVLWYRQQMRYYIRMTRAEKELESIRWLLSQDKVIPKSETQPYGDVTLLNTNGIIKKYIPSETLEELTSWFMGLLDSSSAVYEINGDYAYGVFTSKWCRCLDNASRNLCTLGNNEYALKSGKWLCHESCWECSRSAIEQGKPMDIECEGGIHLYAVPIFAGESIVGAINFGYGDPPKDEKRINEIASKYNISPAELMKHSEVYKSRPDFIIELAKKRLVHSAQLLGRIIELQQVKEVLEDRKDELGVTIEQLQASEEELQVSEEELKKQVDEIAQSRNEAQISRERYKQLIENMYSAVAVYEAIDEGEDFVFIEFNEAAQHIEKLSREEVIGKKTSEVFPGVIDMGILEAMREVYRTGKPVDMGTLPYTDNRITGYRRNYVYKLPSGEIVALYEDETERVVFEGRLKASEQRLKTLYNNMSQGVVYFDSEGRITDVNPSAEIILEMGRDKLLEMSTFSTQWATLDEDGEQIDPEEHPSRIALKTGHPCEKVLGVYISGSKAYKWLRINAIPDFREGEKEPYRPYIVISDITERKKINDYSKIRTQLNVELSAAMEMNEVCRIVMKRLTEFESIDSGAIYLFDEGMNLNMICDKGLNEIFVRKKDYFSTDSPNAQMVLQGLPAFMKSEEIQKALNEDKYDDDFKSLGILPIKLRGKPLGSINIASHTLENIPEFLQDMLKSIALDIAYTIGRIKFEQEKKRMQEMLYQSQKMEAIGQLAGGISHDFNNMLAGIIGTAELMLMDKTMNSREAAEINKILNMAEIAAGRTSQLLAFARKRNIEMTKVNTSLILDNVTDILRTTIDKKIRISVTNHCPEQMLLCDISLIENALLNIGLNARDAMPEGGEMDFACSVVELTERFLKDNFWDIDPGTYLRIAVSDTGTGINNDIKEHVFEPFFTTKSPSVGTGLGLASAYGTVKEHEGHINIESIEGKGTTVNIYLPVKSVETVMNVKNKKLLHKEGATIMIIDDEEMIRNVMQKALIKKKANVILSSGGQKAIDLFRNNKDIIDLVILDMIMPEMSGSEVFERIKQIKPDVKVLIVSGYALGNEKENMTRAGVKGFIKKPFNIGDLLEAIFTIIES